jgi:hypothetical protein
MTRGDIALGVATTATLLAAAMRCVSMFQSPSGGIAIAATPAAQPSLEIVSRPLPPTPSALQRAVFARPAPAAREVAAAPAPVGKISTGSASVQLPRLLGVIVEGSNRVAVISLGGAISRIRENSKIGNWTVTRIDERSALLHTATTSEVLWLDKPRQ